MTYKTCYVKRLRMLSIIPPGYTASSSMTLPKRKQSKKVKAPAVTLSLSTIGDSLPSRSDLQITGTET